MRPGFGLSGFVCHLFLPLDTMYFLGGSRPAIAYFNRLDTFLAALSTVLCALDHSTLCRACGLCRRVLVEQTGKGEVILAQRVLHSSEILEKRIPKEDKELRQHFEKHVEGVEQYEVRRCLSYYHLLCKT